MKSLLCTTRTLTNKILFGTVSTVLAAAHNQTLTIGPNWSFSQNTQSLHIGNANADGRVVWESPSHAVNGPIELDIDGGTFKAGDANFNNLFASGVKVDVAAGAKLDLAGVSTSFVLEGFGTVTSSSGAPTLSFRGTSTFAGTLAGSLALDVGQNVTLTGTNTYSGGTTIESGNSLTLGGGGTAGSILGAIANSGDLIYDRSGVVTIHNLISGGGQVKYEGGATYLLNGAEAYSGQTVIQNAKVEIGNAQSLGDGRLAISNGELLATRTFTLAPNLIIGDGTTLAAAHNVVLTLDNLAFKSSGPVTIGEAGSDAAVVIEGTIVNAAAIEVRAGTLRAGDGTALNQALGGTFSSTTTVEAGAVIDWAGFGGTIRDLLGSGTVTNAGGMTITLLGGDFAGTITGNTALEINGPVILSGTNTYTRGTTIDSSAALSLGGGGTTGSIAGNIMNNGTLIIDHSNAFAETAAVSGSGSLMQRGTGTTTIDRAETYSGGTTIAAGELSIDRAAAIGSGQLDLSGGELLVTKSAALANALSVAGDATIAAATGTILALKFSDWSFDAHSITFGDDTNHGTVVWHTPAGGSGVVSGDVYTVDIHAGVLRAADANLGELLGPAESTTIDAGATLSMGSFGGAIGNLLGSGTLSGSSGAVLDIEGGHFAGQIKGDVTVEVLGNLEISGSNTFDGQYGLDEDGATLTLDHAAKQDIAFIDADATIVFTLGHRYSGTVSNFGQALHPTMDFAGIAFAHASEHFHNGVLTITDGTHSEHVHLAGTFSNASFALSDDHHGGTDVNFTGTTDIADFGLG